VCRSADLALAIQPGGPILSSVERTLTSRQALEVMRVFIAQFKEKEPVQHRERFEQLLRWTRMEPDGVTYDPGQWDAWEKAVAVVLDSENDSA